MKTDSGQYFTCVLAQVHTPKDSYFSVAFSAFHIPYFFLISLGFFFWFSRQSLSGCPGTDSVSQAGLVFTEIYMTLPPRVLGFRAWYKQLFSLLFSPLFSLFLAFVPDLCSLFWKTFSLLSLCFCSSLSLPLSLLSSPYFFPSSFFYLYIFSQFLGF